MVLNQRPAGDHFNLQWCLQLTNQPVNGKAVARNSDLANRQTFGIDGVALSNP